MYLQLGADSYKRGQGGTGVQTKSAPERERKKMRRYENRDIQREGENIINLYAEQISSFTQRQRHCVKCVLKNKQQHWTYKSLLLFQTRKDACGVTECDVRVCVRLTDRCAVECRLSTVGGLGVYWCCPCFFCRVGIGGEGSLCT